MMTGFRTVLIAVAGLAGMGTAGLAQAQPEYGYDALPPPPYAYAEAPQAAPCRSGSFTLLGAHAGVTVLGVDLGAGAHLGVPTGSACGEGEQGRFVARPHAPPSYGYEGQEPSAYGPPPPQMGWGYGNPCRCDGPPGW